ncbi:glycosyltransferase family 2 protein [Sphaerotilus natans]|uniref:glycosyltransferase family 2 protein n=1 Tax=Sphaerotilus natans TaxID=34103 RepID=UPI00406CA360
MKVSIVTCTWNSRQFLPAAMDSVRRQTHADIECIFVDGGSDDGTLELIETMERPFKVLHGVRGGISRAMNEGLHAATGDVVAHLHSDDFYLHDTVVADVVAALEGCAAGWAFGRIVNVIEGRQVPESFTAPPYSREALLRRNFIPHPATFVRRDWMEAAGGFDVGLRYAMDYDLWLRLSARGDPVCLPEALAAFRQHPGSLSSSNRLAAFLEDHEVRMRHVGPGLLDRLEHRARFMVRRARMRSA